MYYRLFHIYEQSATKLTLVNYEVHFADDKIKNVEVGRMVSAVSTIPVDSSNGRISWECHRYAIVQFLLNDKTKYLMCTHWYLPEGPVQVSFSQEGSVKIASANHLD